MFRQAGSVAKELNARLLLLSHFSSKYRGDDSRLSVDRMEKVEEAARNASGLKGHQVIGAWDQLRVPIPQKDKDWEAIFSRVVAAE